MTEHIAFERHGPRTSISFLALPGWGVSRGVFRPLVETLAARHDVIALDWRSHGDSRRVTEDFGEAELVADALAVIEQTGAERVVPIAQAHAGWIALALRRRLGDRIPAVIATSWIVGEPPPPFVAALEALEDPARWQATRDRLFAMWLANAPAAIDRWIRDDMGSYDAAMWARAARAIAGAYRREGTPLAAFARASTRLLHVFAQPRDPAYLAAQQDFAREHPWFAVHQTSGASHFPTLETPGECAAAIEAFVG